MRSYGRGFARKAEFTKKCSCDNPRWSRDHIEVNSRTGEITYVLNCANCKAYWATKSPSARAYWEKEMDKSSGGLFGYGGRSTDLPTVREKFRELDMERLEYLETVARNRDDAVSEAQKEAEKAHREVEKFKKQMGGGL